MAHKHHFSPLLLASLPLIPSPSTPFYSQIHKFCAAQTSTFNVLILGCGLDPLGRWIEITFPSVGVVYEMDCKEIVEEKRRAYDRVGWGVEGILDGCDFDREAEVKGE